jgi:hypothetical protein
MRILPLGFGDGQGTRERTLAVDAEEALHTANQGRAGSGHRR